MYLVTGVKKKNKDDFRNPSQDKLWLKLLNDAIQLQLQLISIFTWKRKKGQGRKGNDQGT